MSNDTIIMHEETTEAALTVKRKESGDVEIVYGQDGKRLWATTLSMPGETVTKE